MCLCGVLFLMLSVNLFTVGLKKQNPDKWLFSALSATGQHLRKRQQMEGLWKI